MNFKALQQRNDLDILLYYWRLAHNAGAFVYLNT